MRQIAEESLARANQTFPTTTEEFNAAAADIPVRGFEPPPAPIMESTRGLPPGLPPMFDPSEIAPPDITPEQEAARYGGPPGSRPVFLDEILVPPAQDEPVRQGRFTPEELENIRAKDSSALGGDRHYLRPSRENFFRHVQRAAVEHERDRVQSELLDARDHLRSVKDVRTWKSLEDRSGSEANENVQHLDGADASDIVKNATGDVEMDDFTGRRQGAEDARRAAERAEVARRTEELRGIGIDTSDVNPEMFRAVGEPEQIEMDDLGAIRAGRRRYGSVDVPDAVPVAATPEAVEMDNLGAIRRGRRANEAALDMLDRAFPGGRPRASDKAGRRYDEYDVPDEEPARRRVRRGRYQFDDDNPLGRRGPAEYGPADIPYAGRAFERPEDYPDAPIYDGPSFERPEDYPDAPTGVPVGEGADLGPAPEAGLRLANEDEVRRMRRARRIEDNLAGDAPLGPEPEPSAPVAQDAALANNADIARGEEHVANLERQLSIADGHLNSIDEGRTTHQYSTRSAGERKAWTSLDADTHDTHIDNSLERAMDARNAFDAAPAGGPAQGTAPSSFGTNLKQELYNQASVTGLGVGLLAGEAAGDIEQAGEKAIFGPDGLQTGSEAGAAGAAIARSGVTGAITAPLAHYGTEGLAKTGVPQAIGRGARAVGRSLGVTAGEDVVEEAALGAGTAAAGVGLGATIPGMAVSAAVGTAADIAAEKIVGLIQGDGGSKGGGYAETRMGVGAAIGGAAGGAAFVPATAAAAGIFSEMAAGAAYGSMGGLAGVAAGALMGTAMGLGGYFWGKHKRKKKKKEDADNRLRQHRIGDKYEKSGFKLGRLYSVPRARHGRRLGSAGPDFRQSSSFQSLLSRNPSYSNATGYGQYYDSNKNRVEVVQGVGGGSVRITHGGRDISGPPADGQNYHRGGVPGHPDQAGPWVPDAPPPAPDPGFLDTPARDLPVIGGVLGGLEDLMDGL